MSDARDIRFRARGRVRAGLLLTGLLVLLIGAAVAWLWLQHEFEAPGPSPSAVRVEVEPDSSRARTPRTLDPGSMVNDLAGASVA